MTKDTEDNPEISSFGSFRSLKKDRPDLVKALKRRGRPVSENPKQHIGMRLDADIVEWLRSHKGYNALVNEALREYMQRH